MSWRTAKAVVVLRSIGRALGLNKLVGSLLAGGDYEDRFQTAMLGTIRAGDVVWDVGANVGFYSAQFAALVGADGQVIAFEPSPINLRKLDAAVGSLLNVRVIPVGLGQRDETISFEQGTDDLGATSRFTDKAGGVSIPVRRGDALVESEDAPIPSMVKIDTEGFELDVLKGMQNILMNKRLRALCIEIHFGLLEARGLGDAAADVEKMLLRNGFDVAWPDASHIVATRDT